MAYTGSTVFDRFTDLAKRAGVSIQAVTVPGAGMQKWLPWVIGGAFVLFMFSKKR